MRKYFGLLLRAASWLVPAGRRPEWLAEWTAELWYVHERAAVAFCLGSFKDALWLRNDPSRQDEPRVVRLKSPWHCLLLLAALAVATSLTAWASLGVRSIMLPPPYRDARSLIRISPHAKRVQGVSFNRYESWTHGGQRIFSGLAFYRIAQAMVSTPHQQAAEFRIVVGSANLFDLLSLPVSTPPLSQDGHATLILSNSAWRKYFGKDPRIVGRTIRAADQQALVAGIIPDDSWRLTGHVDAWLLEDDPLLTMQESHSEGFLLARAEPGFERRLQMICLNNQGAYDTFDCVPVIDDIPKPFQNFLLFVLLTAVILPVTTSLSLGEYPASRSIPSAIALRRWIFLFSKVGLLLAIIYFGSFDLVALFPPGAGVILPASILSFRWALMDQRQRCPVCLRILTNPARIGHPSQTFLEWYGTELMCAKGHGLLHVPEIATSCYSTQRWLPLDPSWSGLFL